VFTAGTVTCQGVTDANGIAVCSQDINGVVATILGLGYTAMLPGDLDYAPSVGSGAVLVVNGLRIL
jgi:hypothetical protein